VRNLFANLGLPLWLFSETLPANKNVDKVYDEIALGPVKAVPANWTNWDSIKIQGPKTLGEIIEYIKLTYKLELTLLEGNKQYIYPSKDSATLLKMYPEQIFEKYYGQPVPKHKKYMDSFVFGFNTEDGIDATTPKVIYIRPI